MSFRSEKFPVLPRVFYHPDLPLEPDEERYINHFEALPPNVALNSLASDFIQTKPEVSDDGRFLSPFFLPPKLQ